MFQIEKIGKEFLFCIEKEQIPHLELLYFQNIFFMEPQETVYVLEQGRLAGRITAGGFAECCPDVSRSVDCGCSRLFHSERVQQDAEAFFRENASEGGNVHEIPIIDQEGALLYAFRDGKRHPGEESSAGCRFSGELPFSASWLRSRGYRSICIVDYAQLGRILQEGLKAADVKAETVQPAEFFGSCWQEYDGVIDCDPFRAAGRHHMLRDIGMTGENRYLSFWELKWMEGAVSCYESMKTGGVKFYAFELPSAHELESLSETQKRFAEAGRQNGTTWRYYLEHADSFSEELKDFFGTEDYRQRAEEALNPPVCIMKGDIPYIEEFRSTALNVVDGCRLTTGKEWENYVQELGVFGPCTVFGSFACDEETIPSVLQQLCNKSSLRFLEINNYGMVEVGFWKRFMCMKRKKQQKGDVVVWLVFPYEEEHLRFLDPKLPVIRLAPALDEACRELGNVWFLDNPSHCSYKANRVIAEKIHQVLLEEYAGGVIEPQRKENVPGVFGKDEPVEDMFPNKELEDYIRSLEARRPAGGGCIGAAVMNCNPFTNGHRYLVETAASKVDHLFLFVVEEDRSFFTFPDRIRLVRLGTRDLPNVTVLPSSKFMISNLTFSEYFRKDERQEAVIDASLDVELFAEYIAPALGISVRFVGEEPFDQVTRQYNEAMKRLFPAYGIELVEIPRKSIGNAPENIISASKVRRFLKEKNWDEIRKYVPETTFDFLHDAFAQEEG